MGCCHSNDSRKVMTEHIRRANTESKTGRKRNQAAKLTDVYNLGRRIGIGGFGEVKEGIDKSSSNIYAVKILSKLVYAAEKDREHMRTETNLMASVKGHPNVVELHETYEDTANFYLVMEYCTGGELMARIEAMEVFSEKTASKLFRQMCAGVKWCHEHNVVHRDLKPENFLFQATGEDAPLKLTDFGLATHIENQDSIIKEACGSAYYIAPEVFSHNYTKAVDVWSLGIILYLLLSGTVPFGFKAREESEVYHSIQTDALRMDASRWAHVSAAAQELVAGLLEKDPHKRYTLDQALAHPWTQGDVATDTPISRSIIKSMQTFNRHNKFKKAALRLIASTLSASEVQKLRRAFHEIDADNTGTISFAEMVQACKRMHIEADVSSLISKMDEDGDGVINYDEFITATADRQLVNHQNNIWWAFCEYDKNGDGYITKDELKMVLGDDAEMIAKYVSEFDRDNDGRIDYEEFMRMVLPTDLRIRIAKYG